MMPALNVSDNFYNCFNLYKRRKRGELFSNNVNMFKEALFDSIYKSLEKSKKIQNYNSNNGFQRSQIILPKIENSKTYHPLEKSKSMVNLVYLHYYGKQKNKSFYNEYHNFLRKEKVHINPHKIIESLKTLCMPKDMYGIKLFEYISDVTQKNYFSKNKNTQTTPKLKSHPGVNISFKEFVLVKLVNNVISHCVEIRNKFNQVISVEQIKDLFTIELENLKKNLEENEKKDEEKKTQRQKNSFLKKYFKSNVLLTKLDKKMNNKYYSGNSFIEEVNEKNTLNNSTNEIVNNILENYIIDNEKENKKQDSQNYFFNLPPLLSLEELRKPFDSTRSSDDKTNLIKYDLFHKIIDQFSSVKINENEKEEEERKIMLKIKLEEKKKKKKNKKKGTRNLRHPFGDEEKKSSNNVFLSINDITNKGTENIMVQTSERDIEKNNLKISYTSGSDEENEVSSDESQIILRAKNIHKKTSNSSNYRKEPSQPKMNSIESEEIKTKSSKEPIEQSQENANEKITLGENTNKSSQTENIISNSKTIKPNNNLKVITKEALTHQKNLEYFKNKIKEANNIDNTLKQKRSQEKETKENKEFDKREYYKNKMAKAKQNIKKIPFSITKNLVKTNDSHTKSIKEKKDKIGNKQQLSTNKNETLQKEEAKDSKVIGAEENSAEQMDQNPLIKSLRPTEQKNLPNKKTDNIFVGLKKNGNPNDILTNISNNIISDNLAVTEKKETKPKATPESKQNKENVIEQFEQQRGTPPEEKQFQGKDKEEEKKQMLDNFQIGKRVIAIKKLQINKIKKILYGNIQYKTADNFYIEKNKTKKGHRKYYKLKPQISIMKLDEEEINIISQKLNQTPGTPVNIFKKLQKFKKEKYKIPEKDSNLVNKNNNNDNISSNSNLSDSQIASLNSNISSSILISESLLGSKINTSRRDESIFHIHDGKSQNDSISQVSLSSRRKRKFAKMQNSKIRASVIRRNFFNVGQEYSIFSTKNMKEDKKKKKKTAKIEMAPQNSKRYDNFIKQIRNLRNENPSEYIKQLTEFFDDELYKSEIINKKNIEDRINAFKQSISKNVALRQNYNKLMGNRLIFKNACNMDFKD